MSSTSQTAGCVLLLVLSVFEVCLHAGCDIMSISVAAVAGNLIRKPLSPRVMETQIHTDEQIIIEGKLIQTCAKWQFWFSEITALFSLRHTSFMFVINKHAELCLGFETFPVLQGFFFFFTNRDCCAGTLERTALCDV